MVRFCTLRVVSVGRRWKTEKERRRRGRRRRRIMGRYLSTGQMQILLGPWRWRWRRWRAATWQRRD
jgi:hypothetical protein